VIFALVVLTGPACKGDVPDITTTTFAASLGVDLATFTKTSSGLYYRDVTVSTGALVASGQLVGMHYTGALPNGTQFDANVAPATPFSFRLGTGTVIKGFDEGVTGMHVGGRRILLVPPSLGYGATAVGAIPKNSILWFDITVVSAS
jgi:FKBP-type peptidyl-prolyl cis-trans isomerase